MRRAAFGRPPRKFCVRRRVRVGLLHRQWIAGLAFLALGEGAAAASDLDVLLFESLDAGAAAFSTTGAKIAIGSLDREAMLGLVSLGDGVRVERRRCGCGATSSVMRLSAEASALFGYQWVLPRGVVATFAGFETSYGGERGPRNGLRTQAEAWLRPTEDTLVQAVLIVGTARGSGWTRLSWGYRLFDTYLGPEGSVYLDATGYGKADIGLHATDFVLLDVHIRLSMGMRWETSRARPAPYVTLTTWSPF